MILFTSKRTSVNTINKSNRICKCIPWISLSALCLRVSLSLGCVCGVIFSLHCVCGKRCGVSRHCLCWVFLYRHCVCGFSFLALCLRVLALRVRGLSFGTVSAGSLTWHCVCGEKCGVFLLAPCLWGLSLLALCLWGSVLCLRGLFQSPGLASRRK